MKFMSLVKERNLLVAGSNDSPSFHPLHPNIRMHILHTALYTFSQLMTGRICLTIKSFFSCWSFLFSHDLNVWFRTGSQNTLRTGKVEMSFELAGSPRNKTRSEKHKNSTWNIWWERQEILSQAMALRRTSHLFGKQNYPILTSRTYDSKMVPTFDHRLLCFMWPPLDSPPC